MSTIRKILAVMVIAALLVSGTALAEEVSTITAHDYLGEWVDQDDQRIVEPINGEPYLDRDADFPYKIDHEDLCYMLFIEHGFEWGGDWEDRKDYQHFEIPTDVIAEWYPEKQ